MKAMFSNAHWGSSAAYCCQTSVSHFELFWALQYNLLNPVFKCFVEHLNVTKRLEMFWRVLNNVGLWAYSSARVHTWVASCIHSFTYCNPEKEKLEIWILNCFKKRQKLMHTQRLNQFFSFFPQCGFFKRNYKTMMEQEDTSWRPSWPKQKALYSFTVFLERRESLSLPVSKSG